MADKIEGWAQLQNGAIPLRLQDNGNTSYSLGTSALGAGVANISVAWAQVTSGAYLLKFIDNGDGSYLIGTNNG